MLKVVGSETRSASKETIEVLREALQRAEAGEIVQVAIAYTLDTKGTGHSVGGARMQSGVLLLGAIEMMKRNLCRAIDELQ